MKDQITFNETITLVVTHPSCLRSKIFIINVMTIHENMKKNFTLQQSILDTGYTRINSGKLEFEYTLVYLCICISEFTSIKLKENIIKFSVP